MTSTSSMRLYSYLVDICRPAPDGKPINLKAAAPGAPNNRFAKELTRAMFTAVPFDFTNVADWYAMDSQAQNQRETLAAFLTGLPPCLPPYEVCFTSFPFPNTDRAESGALIITTKIETGYAVTFFVYHMNDDGSVYGPYYGCSVAFDEFGEIAQHTDSDGDRVPDMRGNALSPYEFEDGDEIPFAETYGQLAVCIALFGFSLFHCKNVSVRHERPTRQQARLRERRGFPVIVWKTLTVDPLAKPKTPQETIEYLDESNMRRLHMVRGHFAEYGPEFKHADGRPKGLLFGRISGRFWVPPIVKGNANAGFVVKTYDVKGKTL